MGDVLCIMQLADDLKRRFAQAPSKFKAISTDVKNLWAVLHDLDDVPREGLSVDQTVELDLIVQRAGEVLLEIDNRLRKDNVVTFATPDWKCRALRAWSRVHWDPGEVEALRGRIAHCLSLWSMVIGETSPSQAGDRSLEIVAEVPSTEASQEMQLRNQTLASIYPVDTSQQQQRILDTRHAGTGKWFLQSQQFSIWVSNVEKTHNVLLCTGAPGTGKTVLASIAIDHLQREFADSGSVAIAYHFFTYREKLGYSGLLLSLLRQLLQSNPGLYEIVVADAKYSTRLGDGRPLNAEEAQDMLEFAISKCTEVFLVVDALDECGEPYVRHQFLAWTRKILEYNNYTKLKFLATTRRVAEPKKLFQNNHLFLEIRASRDDMESFLEGNLVHLPEFLQRKPELWRDVRNQILGSSDGIFLLVRLYHNLIKHEKNEKRLRALGNRIKTSSGSYGQAYVETIKSIEQQSSFSLDLARRVLAWMTFAARPLTIVELQEATAVEIGEVEFDAASIVDPEELDSACCGLVMVDRNSSTPRLIHYTAYEFLRQTWPSWFPGVYGYLTDTCLAYLSFGSFKSARVGYRHQCSFYPYATHELGRHLRQDPGNGLLLDAFLKNDARVSRCMREMLGVPPKNSGFSGLHFAAIMGAEDHIKKLIRPGKNSIDIKDYLGRTPLTWAAGYGKAAVVKFLLAHGANANPETKEGSTPLFYAAAYGHVEVVRHLVAAGANVHAENKNMETAIFLAARGSTGTRSNPASSRSSGAHALIIQMLLDAGADPNKRNKLRETPLFTAAANGHLDAVKLLIDQPRNSLNADPLTAAAEKGYVEILRLFLKRGVHAPRMMMGTGVSPYFWGMSLLAASPLPREEDKVAYTQLLQDSSSPTFRDAFHRTPLHWAAWGGQVSLVQGILQAGCNPNPRDVFDRTPLFAAICAGKVDTVKALLDHPDTEIQIQDKLGFTPLQEAYRRQISKPPAINPDTSPSMTQLRENWAEITELLAAKIGGEWLDQDLQLAVDALPFSRYYASPTSFYEHCDVCLDTRTMFRLWLCRGCKVTVRDDSPWGDAVVYCPSCIQQNLHCALCAKGLKRYAGRQIH